MDTLMLPSGHIDTFARDRLPPPDAWPDFLVGSGDFAFPDRLNCVTWLLDRWIAEGLADRPCLISANEAWSYGELAERVNRIACVLTRDLGLVPGNRVLLRSANKPMFVACYLAVMKAGGVAVATMPLLRARELEAPIAKAEIRLALCDKSLLAELESAAKAAPTFERIIAFGAPDSELERLMDHASADFAACDTAQDDVCLFGFTSGTSGRPKATMHFHRDVLAVASSYGRHVLRAGADDIFIGSPPLAFTFGLGGLVIFPMAVGASVVLLEKAGPDDLLAAIKAFRPTVMFTAPTAYKAMAGNIARADAACLRRCISAGETLLRATYEVWHAATGLGLMDGIGSTEMLHIFISAQADDARPGATGKPVPGYQAKVVDRDGNEVPTGTPGLLAVRGPTGCRYLDDERQADYVRDGWNYTGDVYIKDADGYFWYQARSDDMIVSAGYNISGPEVEAALLSHPAVAECAVVGLPDSERGMVVTAFVVAHAEMTPDGDLAQALKEHVKAEIAPFKYPRVVRFVPSLPKTPSGKIQRAALRAGA
jgi:2-aminobenzoate-CoA ligase